MFMIRKRPARRCQTCRQLNDYNGWANFETWCVRWMLNDKPGDYTTICELARSRKHLDHAAEAIRDYYVEHNPMADNDNSVYSELLSATLDSVDWHAIAEALRIE